MASYHKLVICDVDSDEDTDVLTDSDCSSCSSISDTSTGASHLSDHRKYKRQKRVTFCDNNEIRVFELESVESLELPLVEPPTQTVCGAESPPKKRKLSVLYHHHPLIAGN